MKLRGPNSLLLLSSTRLGGRAKCGSSEKGRPEPKYFRLWRSITADLQPAERLPGKRGGKAKPDGLCTYRVKRLLEESGAGYYHEIDAEAVWETVAKWRKAKDEPMAARTASHYLSKVKQFCRWMTKPNKPRATRNPLRGLGPIPEKELNSDVRRKRRPLSREEEALLMATISKAPRQFRMTGPDRCELYRFVLGTGLRANELRQLTVGDFEWDREHPIVHIRAEVAKNSRKADQPIPGGLHALRRRTAFGDRGNPPWPRLHATSYGKMLKADMAEARQAWIDEAKEPGERKAREQSDTLAYEDSRGQYLDFHSLRHTFISRLAESGAHPSVAHKLARHAKFETTQKFYTHIVDQTKAAALSQMEAWAKKANRGANRGAG